MLNDAYAEMRDIIKNTRIEVIDSIGFTAALESLVAHYTNISEKPAITLEHDLPSGLRCQRHRLSAPTRSSGKRFSMPSSTPKLPRCASASTTTRR
jgi:hypothetical protein